MVYKNQIIVEKSPDYLSSMEAPKRVYEFNKNMKIILIVRDPVKRAVSHFAHELASKKVIDFNPNKYDETSKKLEKKVLDKNGNVVIRKNNNQRVIYNGMYVIHYKRWLEYFPTTQILVLDGENFITNPYAEIKKIEQFSNLTSFFQKNHFVYDTSKGFYCINKNLNGTDVKCMVGFAFIY
jgi:hypothetical protein